jgi:hypothetical protein
LFTETGGNELETFEDFVSSKYESKYQEKAIARIFKNLPTSVPRVLPQTSGVFLANGKDFESTRRIDPPPIQITDVKSQNLTKRILCVDDSPYNLFVL